MVKEKFGSTQFFENYLNGQLERDGKTHEVIHRVHFALSSLILETTKDKKQAFGMMRNLTNVCEKYSDELAKFNPYED